MKYYVGLDVSMKTTSLCIVDEKGKIIQEANIATDPDALAEVIRSASLPIELVGIESGALSFYLVEALEERKVPAICIDARKMNAILSVTINKNDKNDAGHSECDANRDVYPSGSEAERGCESGSCAGDEEEACQPANRAQESHTRDH
jgi:hypothetical protein